MPPPLAGLRWHLRFSTALLLVIIAAMGITIVIQQRRETRLLSALRSAHNLKDEAIRLALERPPDRVIKRPPTLERLLGFVSARSQRHPGILWNGLPIYVDPTGLNEAGVTMKSYATISPGANDAPVKVLLQEGLDSLGLDYVVKDGLMTVTSRKRAARLRNDPRAHSWQNW